MDGFADKVGFIWSVADLLRGDYKAHEYGRVILPLTVLRRLDATLTATKAAVLAKDADLERQGLHNRAKVLERVAGVPFYNTSPLDFGRLLDDPEHIAANLRTYIAGFSPGAADVLVKYGFEEHIKRPNEARLLYPVVPKFADLDVAPASVSNATMGYIFEELIRRFSEASNETAGEHFTPREVIRLMVNLLLHEDDDVLRKPGSVRTLYDPPRRQRRDAPPVPRPTGVRHHLHQLGQRRDLSADPRTSPRHMRGRRPSTRPRTSPLQRATSPWQRCAWLCGMETESPRRGRRPGWSSAARASSLRSTGHSLGGRTRRGSRRFGPCADLRCTPEPRTGRRRP